MKNQKTENSPFMDKHLEPEKTSTAIKFSFTFMIVSVVVAYAFSTQVTHTPSSPYISKNDSTYVSSKRYLPISKRSKYTLDKSFSLQNQKFAADIQKVLNNVSSLKRNGTPNGIEGTIASILSNGVGGSGPIATMARGVKPIQSKDIDLGPGSTSRSKSSIMRVIRKRSPGLRHIYARYLKQQEGVSGKVTLTFTISASGAIIAIKVKSSTTNSKAFNKIIMRRVKSWKFPAIKSGNTTVTIPFTFI